MKDQEVPTFLTKIQGHPFEHFFFTALFTGMRESELVGLTWDCIDWEKGTIHLYRQLKRARGKNAPWVFTTLKNKQDRSFSIPPSVIQALKKVKPCIILYTSASFTESKYSVNEDDVSVFLLFIYIISAL